MKRNFDGLQPSGYVNGAYRGERRVLWVHQSIINGCPWTMLPKSPELIKARLAEVEGVVEVLNGGEAHGDFGPKYYSEGYDVILDEATPDAVIKLRILKALDFWAIWPDAWDGGRQSVFEAWMDEVSK